MMFGLAARTSSTSIFIFLRAGGSQLVRNTSDLAARPISTSCPSAVPRLMATLRLPRLGSSIMWLTPPGPLGTSPDVMSARCGSPVSGCSTLSTSAPHSASTAPAAGTYVHAATSRTRTPDMMPTTLDTPPLERLPGQVRYLPPHKGGADVKPAPFAYHAPTTVADAVGVLAEHGDEAKVLAGGQSLVPLLALRLARFGHLVDLNRVPGLGEISRVDGHLDVGAMARQAAAERSPLTAAVPLLARALPLIGHFQIRNRGTIGGSIAHADPASELPAVALALDASLVVASPAGERVVPAGSFFVSTWTTSLAAEDVLRAVRFPGWDGRCGFAIEEFARRSGDFAVSGAACGVALSPSGDVSRAAVALFGMGPTPLRAADAESALVGNAPGAADLTEIGELA